MPCLLCGEPGFRFALEIGQCSTLMVEIKRLRREHIKSLNVSVSWRFEFGVTQSPATQTGLDTHWGMTHCERSL